MNIKKILCCTAAAVMLADCTGSTELVDPLTVDSDVLYLYDVKNGAVKVGEDWSDSGDEGFWLPVSDDVYAEFQDPDVVGAWRPDQYFGKKQLEKGFRDGKIAMDSKFTWNVGEDGTLSSLYQENYYENNSVTG